VKSAAGRAGAGGVAETSQPPGGARLTAEDLQRLAALCRDSVERFFGVALDFSPDSLAAADRLISQALETPEPTLGAVLPWGAYLGEVAVRHLGGRWMPGADPMECAVAVGARRMLPFRCAAERLRAGAARSLEACYARLAGNAPG
jgi:hypothetical protein